MDTGTQQELGIADLLDNQGDEDWCCQQGGWTWRGGQELKIQEEEKDLLLSRL